MAGLPGQVRGGKRRQARGGLPAGPAAVGSAAGQPLRVRHAGGRGLPAPARDAGDQRLQQQRRADPDPDLRGLQLAAAGAQRDAAGRLRGADAHPGPVLADPRGGPRPHRHRQERQRQDAGVPRARFRARAAERRGRAAGAHGARACPDARAGAADPNGGAEVRALERHPLLRRHRRGAEGRAAGVAQARLPRHRGHAGQAQRVPRAEARLARPGELRGARRGGPHAGHGLRAPDPQDSRGLPPGRRAPDPALQRHLAEGRAPAGL
mmetsp:Transcript_99270/g.281118  ORF Transcript_99270/g.281118 Transcript_99270/m.281118 type:complete len:266 (+) Transcript_99270:273-1070(+)